MKAKIYEGSSKGHNIRIGIVVSQFNPEITGRLLENAIMVLERQGVRSRDTEVAKVPGAFEIPLAAKRMAQSGAFHGLICLGAVIRGETPHFEYISRAMSEGIARVMLDTGIPVSFGVLTTDTEEQALERAGSGEYNRGGEAAQTVLEMVNLLRDLK